MVNLSHADQQLMPQGTVLVESERSRRKPDSEQHSRELCLPWVIPPEFLPACSSFKVESGPLLVFLFPVRSRSPRCAVEDGARAWRGATVIQLGGEGAGCAVRVCEGDGLEASVAVNFLYGVLDGLEVCSPSVDSSRSESSGGRAAGISVTSSVIPCHP